MWQGKEEKQIKELEKEWPETEYRTISWKPEYDSISRVITTEVVNCAEYVE
jgi:HEPN domain-containing protein